MTQGGHSKAVRIHRKSVAGWQADPGEKCPAKSIYDRFNNIYTMELVSSKLRGGMQYLKSRHVRGSDEKTMLTARVEVLEQLSFFTEEDGD